MIEKNGRQKGERRTVITKGTGRERFVNGNDVRVPDMSPLFDWLEGSLMHKTKILILAYLILERLCGRWACGHT
jgi:hypothetical protein